MSLISMLQPGMNFPDNQGKFDQTQKCPVCHGGKWDVRPNEKKKIAGIHCHRCGGTGKQRDPGGQHQTRCKKISELSAQDVLGYAQGMPDREFKALLWKYFQDIGALRDVQRHLIDYTNAIARKQEWTYVENAAAPRIERLCLLACKELENAREYNTMTKRAAVMEIGARAFDRSWFNRYMDVQGEVTLWSLNAEDRIYRRHGEPNA